MSWTETEAAEEREACREFRRNFGVLALDSEPRDEIKVMGLEMWTTIPVDQEAMSESSFIQSLFEGVNHETGRKRVEEYERQKRTAQQLARVKGGRHAA